MNLMRGQLRDAMTAVQAADGEFAATFALPSDFVGFQGHFPGNPVMPGVCMVAAVLLAIEPAVGAAVRMARLKSAKFFSPIAPGDRLDLRGDIASGPAPREVRASLGSGDRKVARVILYVEPVEPAAQE